MTFFFLSSFEITKPGLTRFFGDVLKCHEMRVTEHLVPQRWLNRGLLSISIRAVAEP